MKPYLRPVLDGPARGERWLRVLTYNILAQSLIRRDQYPTNGNAIRVGVRYPVLLDEIEAYRPNVLCLQEVDKDRTGDWESLFDRLKLDFMYFAAPAKRHGLLVAWDTTVFACDRTKAQQIFYDELPEPPLQTTTDNVGLLLVLDRKDTNESLVVGTTHLYWHPDADYERFRQAAIFVSKVAELAASCEPAKGRGGSSATNEVGQPELGGIVLGADFNSTPDSPAYELLASGMQVSAEMRTDLLASAAATQFGTGPGAARQTLLANSEHAVDRVVTFAQSIAQRNGLRKLRSCYKQVLGTEPEFTNWTQDFKATIDYIFATDPLVPAGVLELPPASSMGPEPSSLPRHREGRLYPSDHLPLMADLAANL